MTVFVFKREVEEGSNEKRVIDSALCNFQISLTQADNGEIEDHFGHVLTLRGVLFFFTGFDRIPAFEVPKLIDANFDKETTENFDVCFKCNIASNKHRKGVKKNIHKFCRCIRKYLFTLDLIIVLKFC